MMLTAAWIAALAWFWLLTMRGGFWYVDRPPPASLPPPGLPGEGASVAWPSVVALIPARDEAASIGATVTSLLAQDYPGALTIIVTDDGSRDGTAALARSAAEAAGEIDRLTVIAAPPLPSGWRGKMWAQFQGYQVAQSQVPEAALVLLSDADITHAPQELKVTVARLLDRRLDVASLMVRLSTETWAEKVVIPAFVFFFRLLYPFAWVADSRKTTAAAAGGYMLIRRDMLDRIGGFEAMRGELIDDCGLARRVKQAGGRLSLDLADETCSSRRYAGFGELWMMIARSAYTQLNHSPWMLLGTVVAMALGFFVPPLAVLAGGHAARLGLTAWAEMTLAFAPMVIYYRLPLTWAPLLPAMALFYLAATLDSARRYARGQGGAWKGRLQAAGDTDPAAGPATGPNDSVEQASGKGAADENFPVGSLLIPRRLRRHVHAFYRFARTADDVADAAELVPAEKLRRLDRMAAVLDGAPGDDAPAAAAMRQSLVETNVDMGHCHDLLAAFRQDAEKSRYEDWDELMAYCRLSAAPVGRYVLDLHGEPIATRSPSDALCAALQVINHLQDCAADYRALDRVYLPRVWLAAEGIDVDALAASSCSPGLRAVIGRCIAATHDLVRQARRLPGQIRHFGLRCETAIIVAIAERLLVRLSEQDPLAGKVKLRPLDVARCVAEGTVRAIIGGAR